MKTKILITILATLAVTNLAQGRVQRNEFRATTGEIAYGGTGCPAGTASSELVLDENDNTLGLVFDSFSVSTDGRQIDRKSCNITIPIVVPEGFALVLPQVIIEGAAAIKAGEFARINTEVFYAGGRGPTDSFIIDENSDREFRLKTRDAYVRTACGQGVNLRVNMSALLQGQIDSGSLLLVEHLKMQIPLNLVSCN